MSDNSINHFNNFFSSLISQHIFHLLGEDILTTEFKFSKFNINVLILNFNFPNYLHLTLKILSINHLSN
jgi:hypothetical protein